ncbi:hypothetical protein G5C51_22885 [Streptomyces sp. A7024]|uniref:Lipoprotein n=1 Tax=Streptomyces coryli TaxID=1128680 RepID=A0A6G4U614_9ACTN|nr:hypothetical protein [Streptomyces coryli]NGN66737.1 hypothetical protein [Streptomyces coryli]
MNQSRKRKSVRILSIAPLAASALLLAGCSGGTSEADSGSGKSGASPTSQADKGIAYAKCMRENGVKNFPDPENGQIKITPGSGLDMKSPEFQKAQEACKKLSPQGDAGAGGKIDSAKAAAWAECIRKNGIPDFPDPEIKGGAMEIDLAAAGIKPQGDKFQKAMSACQSKRPQGGMMIKGGAPQ